MHVVHLKKNVSFVVLEENFGAKYFVSRRKKNFHPPHLSCNILSSESFFKITFVSSCKTCIILFDIIVWTKNYAKLRPFVILHIIHETFSPKKYPFQLVVDLIKCTCWLNNTKETIEQAQTCTKVFTMHTSARHGLLSFRFMFSRVYKYKPSQCLLSFSEG